MMKYKKLKTEKILNLNKAEASFIETNSNGSKNVKFEFVLPYTFSNLSKNTEMEVLGFSFEKNTSDYVVIRCSEVDTTDIYDSKTGNGAIIYHTCPSHSNFTNKSPIFKISQAINKLTLTFSNNFINSADGIDLNETFLITLVIRDYDIEEVQPEGMPLIEAYHKFPQMVIKY